MIADRTGFAGVARAPNEGHYYVMWAPILDSVVKPSDFFSSDVAPVAPGLGRAKAGTASGCKRAAGGQVRLPLRMLGTGGTLPGKLQRRACKGLFEDEFLAASMPSEPQLWHVSWRSGWSGNSSPSALCIVCVPAFMQPSRVFIALTT